MKTSQSLPQDDRPNREEITKWTRRYAGNRTVPFMVFMLVFLAFCGAIAGLSLLAGRAWRQGDTAGMAVYLPALAIVLIGLVWFSVPRWGGRAMEKLAGRAYSTEGLVKLAPASPGVPKWVQIVVVVAFGACVAGSVILGILFNPPIRYMQPISATYCIPFMLFLGYARRGEGSAFMLLWPGLYAVHAVLIVAGAPIVFTGAWESLNMLIPVAGYGMLAGLAGHVYSRFALHRLRHVARAGLRDDAAQPGTTADHGCRDG